MDTQDVVLILTCADDATAEAVIAELDELGARYVQLDTGDFPTQLHLSARTTGGGWTGRLVGGNVGVDLSSVRSVYCRRPTQFRLPDGMSQADQVFAASEARHAIGGLLACLDVLWVNDPIKQATAEYKPLQLARAAAAGLTTPATLLTNHQPEVAEFAAAVGGSVVCKQMSGLTFTEGDGEQIRMTYTTRIDPRTIDPAQFAATAHLVQEWVPKQYEARVTVVGREPFAVAIRSASPAGRVDWRADYDALSYEPIDTPAQVRAGIDRFMDALGLAFGAFDFVIRPDGHWVMLECNPAGQWLWLEHETGVPIAAAIAQLLLKGMH